MGKSGMVQGKRAVVFGGGGSIGAAVAQELASEGAEVFLAGRSSASVEVVAEADHGRGWPGPRCGGRRPRRSGGRRLPRGRRRAGGRRRRRVQRDRDRAISEYGHGKPVVELAVEEFMTPVATVLRSQFITARAAARQMLEQRSGVIIFLTAIPARLPVPGSSGIGAAYGAVETVMRTMAIELGPAGVRVVCLRTTANPDTRTIRDTTEVRAKMMNITPDEAVARLAEGTMLKVLPQTADTARAAAFLARTGRA